MTTFAERLKNAMEQANMSQSALSEQAGASKAAISQYLSGKNTPGPDRIKALADATGVSFDYLMGYVIRDYAEFQGIMGSEQPEIEKAWNTTDDLLDNQFIPTAGNMGLSRWEKILGITPKGTDSLEDRRFRILTRINEELPYTLPQLRNILETLCGKGNYSADVEEGTYQLLVKIGLAAKNNFNDVESLLNRVVPQNMVVTLLQLYNTHAELGRFTHAQLAAYTHNQLRNEVLKNGE